jgi:hypothetical protein
MPRSAASPRQSVIRPHDADTGIFDGREDRGGVFHTADPPNSKIGIARTTKVSRRAERNQNYCLERLLSACLRRGTPKTCFVPKEYSKSLTRDAA